MVSPIGIQRPQSLSSALMMGITLYRNRPGIINKIEAQIGYGAVFVTATVETSAAYFFNLFMSFPCTPVELYNYSITWLSSSLFCVPWAFVNFFLNPFTPVLVADEPSAWQLASSVDVWRIPLGALI